MKKVFFFIFLMFLSITFVIAKDIDLLNEYWQHSFEKSYPIMVVSDNYVLFSDFSTLNVLNKRTKEIKNIEIDFLVDDVYFYRGYYYLNSDSVFYKYDADLKLVKKQDLSEELDALDSRISFGFKNGRMAITTSSASQYFYLTEDLTVSSNFSNVDGSYLVMYDYSIKLFDKNNNLIKSIDDTYLYRSLVYYDGYYYALSTSYTTEYFNSGNNSAVKIIKFDSSLNVVTEKEYGTATNFIFELFVQDGKLLGSPNGYDFIAEFDNNLNYDEIDKESYDFPFYEYDLDMYYKYFEDSDTYQSISRKEKEELTWAFGDYYAYDISKNENGDYIFAMSNEHDNKYDYMVYVTDKNGKEIFKKEYSFDEYTVVSAGYFDEKVLVFTSNDQNLSIYDLDGKLLKQYLLASDKDFVNFKMYPSSDNKDLSLLLDSSYVKDTHHVFEYQLLHYQFDLLVDVKESTGGAVKLIDKKNYKEGDKVSLNVVPEEGYELSKLVVTATNGTKIQADNSSFVMPSDDVVVEAVFVKAKNPNTDSKSIMFIYLISCIALYLFYYNYNRIKWINN